MIRLWHTHTGEQAVVYSSPVDGSRRLVLSADGTKIASSSCTGTILVWNPEMSPSDGYVSFKLGETSATCLSFSQDKTKLLVCREHEVDI